MTRALLIGLVIVAAACAPRAPEVEARAKTETKSVAQPEPEPEPAATSEPEPAPAATPEPEPEPAKRECPKARALEQELCDHLEATTCEIVAYEGFDYETCEPKGFFALELKGGGKPRPRRYFIAWVDEESLWVGEELASSFQGAFGLLGARVEDMDGSPPAGVSFDFELLASEDGGSEYSLEEMAEGIIACEAKGTPKCTEPLATSWSLLEQKGDHETSTEYEAELDVSSGKVSVEVVEGAKLVRKVGPKRGFRVLPKGSQRLERLLTRALTRVR